MRTNGISDGSVSKSQDKKRRGTVKTLGFMADGFSFPASRISCL